MENHNPEKGKRKALEAIGCSLYIIAFLVMGAVFISKCDTIFQ